MKNKTHNRQLLIWCMENSINCIRLNGMSLPSTPCTANDLRSSIVYWKLESTTVILLLHLNTIRPRNADRPQSNYHCTLLPDRSGGSSSNPQLSLFSVNSQKIDWAGGGSTQSQTTAHPPQHQGLKPHSLHISNKYTQPTRPTEVEICTIGRVHIEPHYRTPDDSSMSGEEHDNLSTLASHAHPERHTNGVRCPLQGF